MMASTERTIPPTWLTLTDPVGVIDIIGEQRSLILLLLLFEWPRVATHACRREVYYGHV